MKYLIFFFSFICIDLIYAQLGKSIDISCVDDVIFSEDKIKFCIQNNSKNDTNYFNLILSSIDSVGAKTCVLSDVRNYDSGHKDSQVFYETIYPNQIKCYEIDIKKLSLMYNWKNFEKNFIIDYLDFENLNEIEIARILR